MNEMTLVSSNKGTQRFYDENGDLHRDNDEPALICTYGSQYWYKHGLQHRVNGPAVITCTYEEWRQNGKLHRLDGPAFKFYGNVVNEHWYLYGKLHREDGPAVTQPGYKAWYRNGEIHRVDGPAIESGGTHYYSGTHYYLFDIKYEKDKFLILLRLVKKFNNNLKKKYREKIHLEIYNNTSMCKDICALVSEYCL